MSFFQIFTNSQALTKNDFGVATLSVDICKKISRLYWPNLKSVNLVQANIGPKGCLYLANAKWRGVTGIYLAYNNLRDEGCLYLKETDWPQLRILNLTILSEIWDAGIQVKRNGLCFNKYSLVNQIKFLETNHIGIEGCKYFTTAKWPFLKRLQLWDNGIGDEGCEILRKAKWPFLNSLQLFKNQIGSEGIKHLVEASWPLLTTLELDNNPICNEGCRQLCKGRWPNLQSIDLVSCFIGDEGCEYLQRGQWPKLISISISQNRIAISGFKCLGKVYGSSDLAVQCEFIFGFSILSRKNKLKMSCYVFRNQFEQ